MRTVDIVDLQGRQLRRLWSGWAAAGPHETVWNGAAAHGDGVPAGLFYVRLRAAGRTLTRALVLLPR